jgi:hypothetical protein
MMKHSIQSTNFAIDEQTTEEIFIMGFFLNNHKLTERKRKQQ